MKEPKNLKMSAQDEDPSPKIPLREVSFQPLHGSRLYSQQDGGALGLEQLRALQMHLMDLQRQKPFKRVLITSAVRGEGKTHVAANLSLSLAAEGLGRILVVDTDVRNPSLHLAFGIPNVFGFKDCITTQGNCWNAVQKIKDFELYVITGGVGSCSAIGPARIANVQRLLDQLEPSFDLIILDSLPILGGVDGKLLSTVADSILVVVGSGKASRRLVIEAQQSLQRDKVLGVVLNRLDPGMACFRSYSDYDAAQTAKTKSSRGGRRKKDSLRAPELRPEDLEPEPETRRQPNVIPIGLHEEVTPVSSVISEPKITAEEDCYEYPIAASPRAPSMSDVITGAFQLDPQPPPQVKAPERENAEPVVRETVLLPSGTRRWWAQDSTINALLVAIVTLAGIVGWALGQSGARYYARQTTPAQQIMPVQSAARSESELPASSSTPSTALTDSPTSTPQTPVSAMPLKKLSKPARAGSVVYDDGKLVVRTDSPSEGSSTTTSNPGTSDRAVTSKTATLRIPSGIARQYLSSEVAPEYPEPAREQHIEGPVVLDLQVDKNGRVQKLTTLSGNPLLAAAATSGVQQWRFRPFYYDGRAQEFETQVTVNFKLPARN